MLIESNKKYYKLINSINIILEKIGRQQNNMNRNITLDMSSTNRNSRLQDTQNVIVYDEVSEDNTKTIESKNSSQINNEPNSLSCECKGLSSPSNNDSKKKNKLANSNKEKKLTTKQKEIVVVYVPSFKMKGINFKKNEILKKLQLEKPLQEDNTIYDQDVSIIREIKTNISQRYTYENYTDKRPCYKDKLIKDKNPESKPPKQMKKSAQNNLSPKPNIKESNKNKKERN